MYPYLRTAFHFYRAKEPLHWSGTDRTSLICWPWDIDPFVELNNGRTLTLFDIGRFNLARRCGLWDAMRENKWAFAVAGTSIRYRRRVKLFEKVDLTTRLFTWDERFFYVDQSLWKADGECASQALLRTVVTSKNGMVPAAEVAAAMGITDDAPPMPDWVARWIDADATRPWPPEGSDLHTRA